MSGLMVTGLCAGYEQHDILHAVDITVAPGEAVALLGSNGAGKTSLVKAINGLWPYGRGAIVFPEGIRSFYATQDVKLPQVSLKQLVCLPDHPGNHSEAKVAVAMHKAGLGDFIEHLDDETRQGKSWDQLLSGGQKQKLVAARILLLQPGLLFLDEATAALDLEAKIAFHQVIKDNCPGVTVISVMHEAVPPKSALGAEFYDSILSISDGIGSKKALASLPAELTTLLAQPQPTEEWPPLRFPRVRLKEK